MKGWRWVTTRTGSFGLGGFGFAGSSSASCYLSRYPRDAHRQPHCYRGFFRRLQGCHFSAAGLLQHLWLISSPVRSKKLSTVNLHFNPSAAPLPSQTTNLESHICLFHHPYTINTHPARWPLYQSWIPTLWIPPTPWISTSMILWAATTMRATAASTTTITTTTLPVSTASMAMTAASTSPLVAAKAKRIDWPVYDHQTELENARNRGLERARARLPPLPPSPPDFETEQELHMWMLHKFGNVSPEYWKSLEAYYRYGHWFWEDFDEEDEEGYLNNTSLPSMAEVDYPDFSLDITHDLKAAKEEADARVSKRKKKCCEGHAYLWQERNVSRIGIVSVRCKRRSQIQEDIKVKMSPSVRAAIEVLKEEEEARQQAEKEAEEARKQAERETEEKRSANKPESRQVVRGLWNSTDSLHPYQVRHMNKVSHAGTYHSKPWNNYTIG
ncbi:Protein of unknown function [Pyronema omphalodes CBS 100304]|uniref:Uncharacterized protein n=1 Tax=Pyronema omphalodes (strain CBS 100304) TaxID=1076935 RepID=U4LRD9_PYROM|nr:Protein of unknown function [Pyronema omphalodes CBS 100304]